MARRGLLRSCWLVLAASICIGVPLGRSAAADRPGQVVKRVLRADDRGPNLLKATTWQPWKQGFDRADAAAVPPAGQMPAFVCDNGQQVKAQRGVGQTVVLNQTSPQPIVATAESKAEDVSGAADSNYALYLDLSFTDGTSLWGQATAFATGTHDWQRRQVLVLPEKPIKSLSFWMLLRDHSGKAWFRNPALRAIEVPAGACMFDGLPVTPAAKSQEGLLIRDVAAGGDCVWVSGRCGPEDGLRDTARVLGLDVKAFTTTETGPKKWPVDRTYVDLADTTGRDRALTLYCVLPIAGQSVQWHADPRTSEEARPGREYMSAVRFPVGASGRLSHYPLGAVSDTQQGMAVGIDPACPAFFRIGYNAGTRELFLAYDVALTPEQPKAHLAFCMYGFDAAAGFRGALAGYYDAFPEAFRCRTPQQGLWMPFAKISEVKGWEDFHFKFKEGDNETKWDDAHGITTFRYTEPMTWWMPMPKNMPRTLEAAVAEARRLADQGNRQAQALFTSGYQDAQGRIPARLLDTPWCNGAVWSMNSMPGIAGEATDFKNKWNAALRERLYGPQRKADLDGEYIDSSEGYVTDVLDYGRGHFAAAATPLVFSPDDFRPAIFRGLVAFEYVRAISRDMHAAGKLMMANGAPDRLCWLVPLVDVGGTETDWHRQGRWQPMPHAEMLYRRALCKGKPFCFLMNTHFEEFSSALVEKYMQRCLAYGMFPGFFSHNASQGHYFTRPELYDRDRPLFQKYVPLCQRVAEAGWEPLTRAAASDLRVYVERFGDRYLTVFNDGPASEAIEIRLAARVDAAARELVTGRAVEFRRGRATLPLAAEGVAVLDLPQLASPAGGN